jgi:hypothetical protein
MVSKKRIRQMRLAPDAVQIVVMVSLTEGYRSKLPFFHKLFLGGVEKSGKVSGHRVIETQKRNAKTQPFSNSDDPITR